MIRVIKDEKIYINSLWILISLVIPTNALLIFNGMNITNESIQVTQGAALQVACRGGQGSTWKMGAINIRFSASANVYQLKSPISSYLFIKSVKPPNAGTYTCHIDGTQEYVTVEIEQTSTAIPSKPVRFSTPQTTQVSIPQPTQVNTPQPTQVSTPQPTQDSTTQSTQVSTLSTQPHQFSKVQGVTVTRTVQGSSPALRVSWSAVSGSGITYTVCYSTTSGTRSDPPSNANCSTSGITGTSTTLGPLSRGTTYYIWVAAVSSGGQGPYSDRRKSTNCNDLFNASRSANNNTAMIVGVLSGGIAIGVVAVLLVQGIVCGVCKLKNWKKHPTSSTETDPIDENKADAIYEKVDENHYDVVAMTTSPAYEGVSVK